MAFLLMQVKDPAPQTMRKVPSRRRARWWRCISRRRSGGELEPGFIIIPGLGVAIKGTAAGAAVHQVPEPMLSPWLKQRSREVRHSRGKGVAVMVKAAANS